MNFNRYRQPVYRQNGGPMMAPPAMAAPPPMAPPPEMPPELPAEGIESALTAQMSDNVGNAQDTTQLIDAIRGNSKPLQARYDELATYVGPRDAQVTPDK